MICCILKRGKNNKSFENDNFMNPANKGTEKQKTIRSKNKQGRVILYDKKTMRDIEKKYRKGEEKDISDRKKSEDAKSNESQKIDYEKAVLSNDGSLQKKDAAVGERIAEKQAQNKLESKEGSHKSLRGDEKIILDENIRAEEAVVQNDGELSDKMEHPSFERQEEGTLKGNKKTGGGQAQHPAMNNIFVQKSKGSVENGNVSDKKQGSNQNSSGAVFKSQKKEPDLFNEDIDKEIYSNIPPEDSKKQAQPGSNLEKKEESSIQKDEGTNLDKADTNLEKKEENSIQKDEGTNLDKADTNLDKADTNLDKDKSTEKEVEKNKSTEKEMEKYVDKSGLLVLGNNNTENKQKSNSSVQNSKKNDSEKLNSAKKDTQHTENALEGVKADAPSKKANSVQNNEKRVQFDDEKDKDKILSPDNRAFLTSTNYAESRTSPEKKTASNAQNEEKKKKKEVIKDIVKKEKTAESKNQFLAAGLIPSSVCPDKKLIPLVDEENEDSEAVASQIHLDTDEIDENCELAINRREDKVAFEGPIWKKRYFCSCLWHKRHFVLLNDGTLTYYRDKNQTGKHPIKIFTLRDMRRLDELNKPHSFRVILKYMDKEDILAFDNESERNLWAKKLADVNRKHT